MSNKSRQPDRLGLRDDVKRNVWPIFISYRRSVRTQEIALELKRALESTTIEGATGQIFALDVFVDVAEAHQSDFQANLIPHLQHSRALIVLADSNATIRKADGCVDYLYEELDWWAVERKKTPPIILQLEANAGARLVADPKFSGWRKVSFMDCFWERWSNDPRSGEKEKQRLLVWLRQSIRDYGLIVHLAEVRRLKRRALIASIFAGVALMAGAIAGVLAHYYAEAKSTAEKNEKSAKRSAAYSHYRVSNDLREKDPRGSLAYLSAANQLIPEDLSIRAALDLATVNGRWPQGFFQQLESSTIAIAEDKKAERIAVATKSDGVYIWNVRNQRVIAHIKSNQATVRRILFLPDGRLVLSVATEVWADERPWFVENRTRTVDTAPKGEFTELEITEQGFFVVDLFKKVILPLPNPVGTLRPHDAVCLDLQTSHDGRTIVALTSSFALVWEVSGDAFAGNVLMVSGTVSSDGAVSDGATFSSMALASSGNQVAVGTLKNEILRATRGDSSWHSLPAAKTSAAVNAIHFSVNERVLVAACGRPPIDRPDAFGTDIGAQLQSLLARFSGDGGAIEIHDAVTGSYLGGAKTPASCVVGCIHPGGTEYFAGLENGSVVSMSLGTGELEAIQSVANSPLTRLTISDSGLLLAAGSSDGSFATINVETFSQHQVAAKHERGILDLCFSSSMPLLFSASVDGRVGFWDLSNAKKGWTEFDIGTGSEMLALSPDASRVAVLQKNSGEQQIIECYETKTGASLWRKTIPPTVVDLAYDADGLNAKHEDGSISRIVTGSSMLTLKPGSVRFPKDLYRHRVQMFSKEKDRALPTAIGSDFVVKPAADNAWDMASGLCKSLVLASRVENRTIRTFNTGHAFNQWALDHKRTVLFTSSSGEAGVRVWRLDTGELAIPFMDHRKTSFDVENPEAGEVYRFAVSSDGSLLASHLNNQNDIFIWDLNSGYCIAAIKLSHKLGSVSRQLDPEKGGEVLRRDNALINDLSFSEDGNAVGVLLSDNSVAILSIRGTDVTDRTSAALDCSFLKLTDTLVLEPQYPSAKPSRFRSDRTPWLLRNSSRPWKKWSPQRIAEEAGAGNDLELLSELGRVVGYAKIFPALRSAVGKSEEKSLSSDYVLQRAWVLSLFGRGRCDEALALLSGWPEDQLSDDLRFLNALLLLRNGENVKAMERLASIRDPKARAFSRDAVDFANGIGDAEPQMKGDDKDGFWSADIPSANKTTFMQLASAEIAWGWIRRGDHEKAIEKLKRVRIEDLGCRAAMLLGFILSAKGEKGIPISQLLLSQYCSGTDEAFLLKGPIIRPEEKKMASEFLTKLRGTLASAKTQSIELE